MATKRNSMRPTLTVGLRPLFVALPALLLVASAQAQTVACEMLKASLATRVPGGVSDFTLEAIPAADPLPAGGKVIGTCQTNTYKVVMRRHGSPAAAAAVAAAGSGIVVAKAAANATPAPVPAPKPAPSAAASAPAVVPVKPAIVAAAPVPPPPPPPVVAPAPAPVPAPAAAPAPVERAKPETPAPAPAPAAAPARAKRNESAAAATAVASEPATPTVSQPGFLARHWKWIAGGSVIVLAGLLWAWVAYRREYDEAGLPRGPKLTVY
jgi:outer membrane biosynthesis protein TonB